jgi:hypothetical protein
MTVLSKKLIFGVTTILISGASFTLAHHSGGTPNSHANTSTQLHADDPTLNAQGVAENPSVSVNVDGKEVPVRQGTTKIPTSNGTAKVTVSGKNVRVEKIENKPSGSSGSSLNVHVHSTNLGGSSTSSSFQSSSSTSASQSTSSSQTSISSNGTGSVSIQTNP